MMPHPVPCLSPGLAVFRISASEAWAAVQYLALTVAVGAIRERGDRVQFDALWITAKEIAELEKRSADEQRRAWASGSLLELWVIRMAQPEYLERDEAPAAAQPEENQLRPAPPNREHEVREQALRELQVLLESADESLYRGATFDLYSTFKQIDRFANWWFPVGSPTQKLAAELCQRLLAHGVPTKYDRPE